MSLCRDGAGCARGLAVDVCEAHAHIRHGCLISGPCRGPIYSRCGIDHHPIMEIRGELLCVRHPCPGVSQSG
eukprot:7391269-Prymnesium_polylepis.1